MMQNFKSKVRPTGRPYGPGRESARSRVALVTFACLLALLANTRVSATIIANCAQFTEWDQAVTNRVTTTPSTGPAPLTVTAEVLVKDMRPLTLSSPSQLSARINWGDGSWSNLSFKACAFNSPFTLWKILIPKQTVRHTYTNAGTFNITAGEYTPANGLLPIVSKNPHGYWWYRTVYEGF